MSVRRKCKLNAVFFLEFINTSAGIDKLLLTGKVRVACGANLHAEVLLDGTRLKRITASASCRRYIIFRLNFCFHEPFTSLRPESHLDPELYGHMSALYHVFCNKCNTFVQPVIWRATSAECACTIRLQHPEAPIRIFRSFASFRTCCPAF